MGWLQQPADTRSRIMCGRYYLEASPAKLEKQFSPKNPLPNHPANYNVAPTQESLVLRLNPATGERSLDPLRWVLTGGEDHALAATFPGDVPLPRDWTEVGAVEAR